MERQIIFMTGATSGLGKIAACEIADKGARLIVACRSREKGKALQELYKERHPRGKGSIELMDCNLSSFRSVVSACIKVRKKYDKLDMIIQNAGIINFNFKETDNRIEETFQVNFLAPVLISHLLFDLLAKSASAKLIFTTSESHQGLIRFDDIEFRKEFSSFKSYRQSKLAIILLCRYFADMLDARGIGIYCLHPGMVKTDIARDGGWFARLIFRVMGKSPEKGAETLIYLAEAPKEKLFSGNYYANCTVSPTSEESYDMNMAQRLIDITHDYLSPYMKDSPSLFHRYERAF